ncbi:hypothetical protein [Actinophytocola xanthii]|uniref:Uncharacterized protein n=1 Tax=Actinophytocola xanthii TaxID=1912961 RepID=A0A1Q8CNU3_9PSEU|nr:hypothetical protein [Actinophytocola xanthii]OLF16020.1 hypothetical protein BU204_19195 [Actinophytocola xanthii]
MKGGLTARRLGIVVVCVVSLIGCVGLAWWQWQRFESSSGSWQNLGYVLQWPLFGLFPAFMFWRLRKLRHDPEPPAPASPAAEAGESWEPAPRPAARTDKDEDDPELAEYNRYLARLNEMDQQESR